MMTLFAVLSAALVVYLNFKHGHSDPSVARDFREVRERDYFFTVGFSVWGLMAGIGIAGLWDWIRRRSGRSLAFGAPVLGLAFIPLVLNFSWATRAGDHSARDWAYNLLMSVEPYGLLFTNGDNDTFPLWYLQEVEGIRRDVTVVVTSYFNTDWYAQAAPRPHESLRARRGPGRGPDAHRLPASVHGREHACPVHARSGGGGSARQGPDPSAGADPRARAVDVRRVAVHRRSH